MKKNDIEGIDACVCMHTALRKCCDSKITSAAYNLIHIIDIRPEKFDAWRILGNLVAEGMNRSDVNWSGSVALASAVEKLLDEFHGFMLRPVTRAKNFLKTLGQPCMHFTVSYSVLTMQISKEWQPILTNEDS